MADTESLERQRRALAEFGIFALRSLDIDAVLLEAGRQAAESLGIEMAKILELRSGEDSLLVRSGYGLMPGIVGHARVPLGRRSAAGLAILTGEAVTSDDTANETRFEISEIVRIHGVRSMANVLISNSDGSPYGVLELDSRRPGMFEAIDTPYLQNYANLVSAALERWRSRQALQATLTERDILMRELQHRVRNDLQAVIGLLVVEASASENPETKHRLDRVRSRVNALRLVHERLFRDRKIGSVDGLSYLADLARSCIDLWAAAQRQSIALRIEGGTVEISHDTAVILGLIVNEFVTNSAKYAFPFGTGSIAVELVPKKESHGYCLILADDGIGFPETPARHSGRRFIETLARQIGARIHWSSEDGVRLTLECDLSAQK